MNKVKEGVIELITEWFECADDCEYEPLSAARCVAVILRVEGSLCGSHVRHTVLCLPMPGAVLY